MVEAGGDCRSLIEVTQPPDENTATQAATINVRAQREVMGVALPFEVDPSVCDHRVATHQTQARIYSTRRRHIGQAFPADFVCSNESSPAVPAK